MAALLFRFVAPIFFQSAVTSASMPVTCAIGIRAVALTAQVVRPEKNYKNERNVFVEDEKLREAGYSRN